LKKVEAAVKPMPDGVAENGTPGRGFKVQLWPGRASVVQSFFKPAWRKPLIVRIMREGEEMLRKTVKFLGDSANCCKFRNEKQETSEIVLKKKPARLS